MYWTKIRTLLPVSKPNIICKMKTLLILISLFVFNSSMLIAQEISIIPKPMSMEKRSGNFRITTSTKIMYETGNTDLHAIAQKLSDKIRDVTGLELAISESKANVSTNVIRLELNDVDSAGAEGYFLSVTPRNVVIKANRPAGVYYGVETIRQLLPVDEQVSKKSTAVLLPAVEIFDRPRFPWRGLMLDVGRYYYSIDFIKEFIDQLAMHKMNTFHWHLTEDHGWRIEIKEYPRLTEVGAWRSGTQFSRYQNHINPNPHGGYYTQDQIREVVEYAKERYVNIVPEVEMPGHTLAVLVAYPELSCTGGPFEIPPNWAIQEDIFCAGNEKTFEFLENVLTEVAELFPSPVIHIGGDEAPKKRWKECPKCQQRIKQENLKDEHELQSYFIKRIEKFLRTKNKKMIGWDEILDGGLAPNAMVMSWRGEKGGISAAKMHHEVVMSPNTYAYLDYYQGEPYHEPSAIGGLLTIEKVYSYEPVPSQLSDSEALYIRGIQGNIWSEFIHSPEKVEYMAYPRAAAIAEIGWSPKKYKDWEDFKRRLQSQYKRYESAGIHYSQSAFDVWITNKIDSATGKATISLKTNSYEHEIRYTTDGTEPTATSRLYHLPFEVQLPTTIKAANFSNGRRISRVSATSVFIKPDK